MQLDHIAISGETLHEAAAYAEEMLGVLLQDGGEHAKFQTHNRLLGLEDGLYLEALAVMPDAPVRDTPRMFGIDKFHGPPRLTNWICRCNDLDATLAALPKGFGQPVDVARGAYRWRMAVPDAGFLPFDNCAPAFIQWLGDNHPALALERSNCALVKLTVTHPEARELAKLLSPLANDDRVVFEAGPAKLAAKIDAPGGAVLLT